MKNLISVEATTYFLRKIKQFSNILYYFSFFQHCKYSIFNADLDLITIFMRAMLICFSLPVLTDLEHTHCLYCEFEIFFNHSIASLHHVVKIFLSFIIKKKQSQFFYPITTAVLHLINIISNLQVPSQPYYLQVNPAEPTSRINRMFSGIKAIFLLT